jgi:hypothetical protein
MRYLGLCAIARDETAYLEEWVQFHAVAGVEHFIIYDNESTVPVSQTLAPYVADGLVTVVDIPGVSPQRQAYDHCLEEFGPGFRWLGFLDLDEFAVLTRDQDLRAFLTEYEKWAGLAANWVTYGSSGHVLPPPGLVTENYQLRGPSLDCHVKCFLDPARTLGCNSPHFFKHPPGQYRVNERFLPVHANHAPHSSELIRINHYFFRSQRDFQAKINNWDRNHHGQDEPGLQALFLQQLESHVVPDPAALPTVKRQKALAARNRPELFARLNPVADRDELFRFVDRATELISAGRLEEAEVALGHGVMHHGQTRDLGLMRATLALIRGRPWRARHILREILEEEFCMEAYLLLGEAALAEGAQDQGLALADYLEMMAGLHAQQGVDLPPDFDRRLASLRRRSS